MKRNRGFSLVELMVTIAVLAIILSLAMPSFRGWLRNIEVRTAAQSVTSGLQKARGEAVARNTNVEFVLGTDSSWTVNVVNPAQIIESRLSGEGSSNVTRTVSPGGATTITFNNLGVITANADGSETLLQVNMTSSFATRDLRVAIGAGGNARMCDPGLSSGSHASAC